MAGDWIKIRTALLRSPKVVRIVSELFPKNVRSECGHETDERPQDVRSMSRKFLVIGALVSVWSLFDEQSEDGVLDGYTREILDAEVGIDGFAAAMEAVNWLEVRPESLALPRFDEHNGASAKRRANDANRKKLARSVQKSSASDADKFRTREEKRREEKRDDSLRSSSRENEPVEKPPPVDNSGAGDDETTTLGEQDAHQPRTPPAAAEYSRTSEMAISIAWLREQGVTIEADSELIAEWAARGVTQGLVEKALAKARTYKLNRIPEKYLATIVAEKLAEKAKPARMSVGQDEASVKAAARALGMGEGNPGESLPELRRRVLQRMSEMEQTA